tara:strand:+ start:568 stop:1536 length:969 start_codon:yes stop_codon:yes gene_type:complete
LVFPFSPPYLVRGEKGVRSEAHVINNCSSAEKIIQTNNQTQKYQISLTLFYESFLNNPKFSSSMAKAKVGTKIKKKLWYKIFDSGAFGKAVLGETFVEFPEQVLGKTMAINMMDLTRDPKKQNTIIKFVVTDMKGEKANAQVIGYGLNNSSVKRMMRRGKARVDLSEVYLSKDGKHVRVKPFIVTRVASAKSTLTDIRAAVDKFFKELLKNTTYDQLVNTLIAYKIQRQLRDQIEKIIPLASCEVREMKLVTIRKEGEKEKLVDVLGSSKSKKTEKPKEVKKEVKEEKKEVKKEEVKKEEKVEEVKPKVEEKVSKEPVKAVA